MHVVASVPRAGEKRRSLLAAVPLHWHLLSLDAPTVAVLWAWTLAREVGASIAWSTLAVLGIGTWLIYVGDRLLDGLPGAPRIDLRERHRFHARHRRPLLAAAAVALVALLWLIARMPAAARREDACVFAVAMVYAAAVHLPFLRIRFPREVVVAVVFACACAVPAWSLAGYAHPDLTVLAALFAALCWLNCSAIHAWERASDGRHLRPAPSRWPLVSLLALAIAAASSFFLLLAWRNPGELRLAAVLFASAMLFFALDRDFRRSLKRRPPDAAPSALTMRVLADAILLTPILLLIPWPK
ncbi:MAG: hypothetical protein WB974_18230 [Acidobacteriaceae bacterium]